MFLLKILYFVLSLTAVLTTLGETNRNQYTCKGSEGTPNTNPSKSLNFVHFRGHMTISFLSVSSFEKLKARGFIEKGLKLKYTEEIVAAVVPKQRILVIFSGFRDFKLPNELVDLLIFECRSSRI